jgi:hypothetical protein
VRPDAQSESISQRSPASCLHEPAVSRPTSSRPHPRQPRNPEEREQGGTQQDDRTRARLMGWVGLARGAGSRPLCRCICARRKPRARQGRNPPHTRRPRGPWDLPVTQSGPGFPTGARTRPSATFPARRFLATASPGFGYVSGHVFAVGFAQLARLFQEVAVVQMASRSASGLHDRALDGGGGGRGGHPRGIGRRAPLPNLADLPRQASRRARA